MSATVLVSGAGGFVGSAVMRRLVTGAATTADRFHDGETVGRIVALVRPGSSLARLDAIAKGSHWSVEHCDVADASSLSAVIARWRPRAVLHLAMDRTAYRDDNAVARTGIERPLETMFRALAGDRAARVIYTSSAWVLPAGDRLDEATPIEPRTAYARNKVHGEQLLPTLAVDTGVQWINLRLFNIFGRYELASRLLPYLVDRLSQRRPALLGNADAIRDFTDVDVVAGAYVAALAAPEHACGATYHIGTGRGITIRDFAMNVAQETGHADRVQFGAIDGPDSGMRVQVANPARARQELGWSAPRDARPDIRAAARWWLARPTGGDLRRDPDVMDSAE